MVKRRLSKKYTKEETDESDSDDFYEEPTPEETQSKKYSLRQRRGTNFAEDFDYDVLEEGDGILGSTGEISKGDKEFSLKEGGEDDEGNIQTGEGSHHIQRTSIILSDNKQDDENIASCTITKYKDRELEPEIPKDNQSVDDMIDFEDVIRADILVNKNRIDYDSIIEKTEIKIEKKPIVEDDPPEKSKKSTVKTIKLNKNGEPPKKRGRKPKKQEYEADYESGNLDHESENVGLPINTVLGVTESLYELAERYHMQGGSLLMESLPVEPVLEPMPGEDGNFIIENENLSTAAVQDPDTVTGAIETF